MFFFPRKTLLKVEQDFSLLLVHIMAAIILLSLSCSELSHATVALIGSLKRGVNICTLIPFDLQR